jgi:hypothetical protein
MGSAYVMFAEDILGSIEVGKLADFVVIPVDYMTVPAEDIWKIEPEMTVIGGEVFHKVFRIDDSRLAELFAHEVLRFLVHKELLSPEWAQRLLSRRHTGFNVHSRVLARTKTEAERVGKYMIRPLLSLERLSLDERQGRVRYQYGKEAKETERMDYLEFIARVTSHILDKGQVTIRYFGLYANAHRGKVKKASQMPVALGMIEEELRPIPSKSWAALINWGHVPNSLEFGTYPLLRPHDLSSMRPTDEGHRSPHRLC